MAKDTDDDYVRKVVRLPATTWREIAEFRHEERIGTETDAIGRLLLMGLRAWSRPAQAKPTRKRKP